MLRWVDVVLMDVIWERVRKKNESFFSFFLRNNEWILCVKSETWGTRQCRPPVCVQSGDEMIHQHIGGFGDSPMRNE
jgi:hypothetical protein